jgi:hypothetical protein
VSGELVTANVGRGDVPSTLMAGEIPTKEGWFSDEHKEWRSSV